MAMVVAPWGGEVPSVFFSGIPHQPGPPLVPKVVGGRGHVARVRRITSRDIDAEGQGVLAVDRVSRGKVPNGIEAKAVSVHHKVSSGGVVSGTIMAAPAMMRFESPGLTLLSPRTVTISMVDFAIRQRALKNSLASLGDVRVVKLD